MGNKDENIILQVRMSDSVKKGRINGNTEQGMIKIDNKDLCWQIVILTIFIYCHFYHINHGPTMVKDQVDKD